MIEEMKRALQCEWGTAIRTVDDPQRCVQQSSRMVRLSNPLHAPNAPLDDVLVRLCPRHASRVVEETTEHQT